MTSIEINLPRLHIKTGEEAAARGKGRGSAQGGGGWSLEGPDPCASGAGEADPEVGGAGVSPVTARKAGARLLGQKRDKEVRREEATSNKGREVRRPRQELAGAGRRPTGAGDGGI